MPSQWHDLGTWVTSSATTAAWVVLDTGTGYSGATGAYARSTVTMSTTTVTTSTMIYPIVSYEWPVQRYAYVAPAPRQVPPQRLRAMEERSDRITAEQDQAEARARELLLSLLSEEQREQLDQGYFEVVSSLGRTWRIRTGGIVGNLALLNGDGVPMVTICGHLPGQVPLSDHLIAQKIWLETDEVAFLDVANVHWAAPGERADDWLFGRARLAGYEDDEEPAEAVA